MSSVVQKFKNFHQSNGLFVLPNAWNVKSALLFEKRHFPAVATSSAAVADSLGYDDGEQMPFSDYLFIIKRIQSSLKIPLSVDIETGYGVSDEEIYANVHELVNLGVAGINIEDSIIANSGRTLKQANKFAKTIEFIKSKLLSANADLFVNIRCDTYILGVENPQQETRQRLKLYESTGADGIFLPCICAEDDIAEAVNTARLPINVMCVPGLPGFDTLNRLGVKRVSMGPFLFNKVYDTGAQLSSAILESRSFSPILS